MSDYKEQANSLREHADLIETSIELYGPSATRLLVYDLRNAAAAIEELQNKVVELEEELNDGDVAADDNAWQIEELQAEVKRLELDNEDYEHEQRRLKGEIEALQAQLPKRGEWELIDGAEPMRWGCSRCKYMSWETSTYCPRCGAKMTEVQE